MLIDIRDSFVKAAAEEPILSGNELQLVILILHELVRSLEVNPVHLRSLHHKLDIIHSYFFLLFWSLTFDLVDTLLQMLLQTVLGLVLPWLIE